MNVSGKRLSQVLAFVVLGLALLWPAAGDRISAAFRSDPDGCAHAGAPPTPENADEGRAALLCLLNARRAEHDLPPLVEDEQLESAAQAHAEDMSARRYFAHRNPDGLSPHERIRRAGYAGRTTGENLYWGAGADGTPAAAVEGWMRSPGHRGTSSARRSAGSAPGSPTALRTAGSGARAGASGSTRSAARPPRRAGGRRDEEPRRGRARRLGSRECPAMRTAAAS